MCPFMKPNTNAQRMSFCHIYCAQVWAHLGAIFTASCAVSNRESRYPQGWWNLSEEFQIWSQKFRGVILLIKSKLIPPNGTARSLEDETRNANINPNPEWWGNLSQLVEIKKIKFLGISRYKVELRFWLDLNSEVSCGTNWNWNFCLVWICTWPKSPHHSGFRLVLPIYSAFRVSSSTEWALAAGMTCDNESYAIWQ